MIVINNIPEMSMGQKLKMLRELNELSQEQLGEKLNVTDKTISAWETGEREINLNNAKAICELFSISNSYFVFNENFNSLDSSLQNKIRNYTDDLAFRGKVDKLIQICKQTLKKDGVPIKKEYLPIFDFENQCFVSYGLFDQAKLPIQAPDKRQSNNNQYISILDQSHNGAYVDDTNLENANCYLYDSAKLSQYSLTDILLKHNSDKVELSDLINCNDIEAFKFTLEKTKTKQYFENSSYYSRGRDVSKEHLQFELNTTLENLNSRLPKFWEIVVFLIDNGAFYTKQIGYGDDCVSWKIEKDVSKTNLVYRIAKDKISK